MNISHRISPWILATCLFATHTHSASWIGDQIEGSVSNPQYDWDTGNATVTLAAAEFTRVFTNATTTADFSSNRLTLTYHNTTSNQYNITYAALSYAFADLDVGGGITGLELVSSNFSQSITTSFTGSSITLDVPLQNTNPGEVFTATFEFTTGEPSFDPYLQDTTSAPSYPFDFFGTTGSISGGFTLANPDQVPLVLSSAFEPSAGLGAGEAVQDGFVMYDGTLFLEATAVDPQGARLDLRSTYRISLDRRQLGRDFLRARYIRQGVITDPVRARTAARAGRVLDARIMRFVEDEGRWIRAVRAAGARADVRFLPRQAPDGIVGHYGTFTREDSTSYVWAVMDRNSRYAVGINVDNDADGVFNRDDSCQNTSAGALIDANGCSIEDSCACGADWKNHGKYVSCVAQQAEAFLESGLITWPEKDELVASASSSDCGN